MTRWSDRILAELRADRPALPATQVSAAEASSFGDLVDGPEAGRDGSRDALPQRDQRDQALQANYLRRLRCQARRRDG